MTLIEDTALGDRLDFVESWIDADGPRLFVAANEVGQHYIVFWVDSDAEFDSYLVVPASLDRLRSARSGAIPLRAALGEPETTNYGLLRFSDDGGEFETLTTIREEWLPDADVTLDLPTSALPEFSEERLVAMSSLTHRPLAAFRVSRGTGFHHYPLGPLGGLMQKLQDLVTLFAAEADERPIPRRGGLVRDIVANTRMSVFGLSAASVVVEIAPEPGPSLFSQTQGIDGIEAIARLLDSTNAVEGFVDGARSLSPRTVSKLAEVLEELISEGAGLSAYTVRNGVVRSGSIAASGVGWALDELVRMQDEEPIERTVDAILVGLNLRTRAYEIREIDSDERFVGRIDGRALVQAPGAVIDHAYRCVLEERVSTSPVTGEETVKYVLKALDQL